MRQQVVEEDMRWELQPPCHEKLLVADEMNAPIGSVRAYRGNACVNL